MAHKPASLSKYTTPPPPYPYSYHVFLSFRGEDTRKNFTDHLYTALINAGFHTFRDDPELERGENIKEKLENAIRQSQSSIIVFSKDYTSSRWCLDELVMILERRRSSNHFVLPVFYDVDPSHVRKQAETLAKVPKYQENQSMEKLNGWRAALGEVADLAGMVLQNEADGHESKFIYNIIRVIREKQCGAPLTDVQEVLQKKLLFINPVLDEADEKQLNNPTVKAWFNDLKEVVYDAEDLLHEIKTEGLRRKMEPESGSSTSMVQAFISTQSHAFDSALIYTRVEEVLNRLDSFMEQRRDILGMEPNAGCRVSQKQPSTTLIEDYGVCGRDDEKETLIKLLLTDDENSNKISVIPIVGMGGIGKTTLAQLLYNDDRVEQHFDIQAWACVSENFDLLRISQEIYESLTSDPCNIVNLNLLQSKLKMAIKGKRIFLVLDDVWNKNYTEWEVLRRPFQFGAHGSKIIVTTRNQDVASMVCSSETHCLMPMSEEDGWFLFEKHAFKNAGVGAHSHLEAIGRQIAQKCKGLPLAIKSLGGLLCSKLSVGEWRTILNSDMWELPQEESDILPSLWLSYKHLPPHLRRCFACCSIFRKNYKFKTSELVYLWMADDLLQPKRNKTAEEIGQDYFNDLVSRSFFQLWSISNEYFVMHDLINDLALFVSGEFHFWCEGSDSPNILSKTRHLAYIPQYPFKADGIQMFNALRQAKFLRTFLGLYQWLISSGVGLYEILPKLQYLRVLNLSRFGMEELPDSVHNLKHLKHLNLSYSSIKKLPDTVCTLYNLQALLLSYCGCLTELPANLGRLINLNHLDIRHTNLKKMPPNMGNLKDLQMLPEFVLDKNTAGNNLPELKELKNLRGRLCISGLVHCSSLEAYILTDMKFLDELELDWRTSEDRDVFEKLQPHLNLERLTIRDYGGRMFPGWSGYYSSSALCYLKLVNCENCISLPPLGQLPSLRELHIEQLHGVISIGSEFYYGDGNTGSTCVNRPFRSLQSLKFEGMSEWKEWCYVGGDDNEGGVFPTLVKLVLSECPNLIGRLTSESLPSLESLSVFNCTEFECFPEDGFPPKLESLFISDCKKVNANCMQNLNSGLRTLTSLVMLSLNFNCDEEVDWFAEEQEGLFPSSLTDLTICRLNCEIIHGDKWFGHLNSLRKLFIWDCPALQGLPDSGLPSSLQYLEIHGCPELQCLPDSGLPSSLSQLHINGCHLLEKQCQRDTGEEWPKIAHIPEIKVNWKKI